MRSISGAEVAGVYSYFCALSENGRLRKNVLGNCETKLILVTRHVLNNHWWHAAVIDICSLFSFKSVSPAFVVHDKYDDIFIRLIINS